MENRSKKIIAKQMGHPLINDQSRVSNDIDIGPSGKFLLVTGSNMSGKSTLLRSIGLNALLAGNWRAGLRDFAEFASNGTWLPRLE